MPAFDDLIEAQLNGAVIRFTDLNRFDFKSGEIRLFPGFGLFVDGNSEIWDGIGKLGQVGAVGGGPGGGIEELTYTLFGDAAMLAHLEADAEEAAGREVSRYLQFCDIRQFDETGRWVDWEPLGEPIQIFWGEMGALSVTRPRVEPGSAQPTPRSISVGAVNAFVNRRKPPLGFFSHRDQLARTGGTDLMFINISRMANATANWPSGLS